MDQIFNYLPSIDFDTTYGTNGAMWSDRDYRTFAKEAYMKNVIAHRAISMISQSAASLKLHIKLGVQKKRLDSHQLLDLLNKPNAFSSGSQLMENLYCYKMLSGNAYLLGLALRNTPGLTELYALRPDRVSVLYGENFVPRGYRYTVGDRFVDYKVDRQTALSEVLHIKNFHPLSDWYGLSSVEAAIYSIDQHNQSCAWNQALLKNGARPSGALIFKGNEDMGYHLTPEQYDRLKSNIKDVFSGPSNAGKPLLLEGCLDWKEMSISPKDMDFIQSKHSAARDIALAFGVPPQLLGIPGDNTYSNLVEARIALWEQTILPMVDVTLSAISNWLSSHFQEELEVSYDMESISILSKKSEANWERIQNATFMTINEKRAAMGLPSIPGGNVLAS